MLIELAKRIVYKKIFLEKDIAMAIRDGSLDRVIRIVPSHSSDLFMKRIKEVNPELIQSTKYRKSEA